MSLQKFNYYDAVVRHTPARLQDYLTRYVETREEHGIDASEYELDIRLLEDWNHKKTVYQFAQNVFQGLWTNDFTQHIPISHLQGLSGTFYLNLPATHFHLFGEDTELLGAFIKCSTHSGISLLDIVLDFGGDAAELWSITYQLHPGMTTLQDFITENQNYHEEISEVLREAGKPFSVQEYQLQAPTIARIVYLITHLQQAQHIQLEGHNQRNRNSQLTA